MIVVDSFTLSRTYFSSTTNQGSPFFAWVVSFSDGGGFADGKFNVGFARAVRGGS